MCILVSVFAFLLAILSFSASLRWKRSRREKTIAFFHPYCNAAGGGERVLWLAIVALQQSFKDKDLVVYCGDMNLTGETILNKVQDVFKITVENRIKFVYLRSCFLLEPTHYPIFTLLFQSLGSIVVALEAVFKFCPHIYIDTTGFSFTHLVFKLLASCKVICYVHYPIVSSDMLNAVSICKVNFNNRSFITNSVVLTKLKLFYYHIFVVMYGIVGRLADVVFVNSTWTKNHIIRLWKNPSNTFLLFPPCDVSRFENCATKDKVRKKLTIVSVSQFRPEKNHSLQLQAFKLLLDRLNKQQQQESKLVLVGSCRNSDDERRVNALKEECCRLGIQSKVIFELNVNFDKLRKIIESAEIGIHTMTNEHFGISIVELMAAGVIVIAHNSGGPKLDIIENGVNGFLASNAEEYADHMWSITTTDETQLKQLKDAAKTSIQKFSDSNFIVHFLDGTRPVIDR